MLYATRAYIEALTTAIADDTGITFREGKQWCADVKNKVLEYPLADLTTYDMNIARGLILHETAHLIYTGAGEKTELEKTKPAMHDVYNALEDIRIEKLMADRYGDYASEALGITKSAINGERPQQTDDKPYSELMRILTQNIAQSGKMNQLGQAHYVSESSIKHSERMMTEKTLHRWYHDQWNLLDITDEVCAADSTEEVKKIADTEVYPLLYDLIDEIKENDMPPQGQQGKPPPAPHEMNNTKEDRRPSNIPSDRELEGLLQPYINTLAKKITDILKERKCTRFIGLHQTGKLLSKNAYRVLTDEPRIFSRKTNPDKADYKIQLLVDDSGSMSGAPHANAYMGAFLLDRVFRKIGIVSDVIRFNTYVKEIQLSDYREHHGGDNDDAGALELAYIHLDEKRENIIIILSDGGICTKVADPLAKLRKRGAVVFGVGVGIDSDELRQYYTHAVNVPDVSQLPIALINLMKKLIAR